MYWKSLFRFITFTFIILSSLKIFAQENKCDLKVNVFEPEEIIRLIEAKVSVKNLNSGAVFDAGTRFEPFIFRNLIEGDYEITVSKDNFKQSVHKVKLNCNQQDKDRENTFGVILQKGSPNEQVIVDESDDKKNAFRALKSIPERSREERLKKVAEVNNILNYKAVSLGKPKYPAAAKAVGAAGVVYVEVTIDEQGNVVSAQSVGGHPLLRAAAAKAAQESKFSPTTVSNQPVKVTGVIVYNFVP